MQLSSLLAGALLAAALPATPPAQDGREPIAEVDPYTRGDERAMAKAGYVSFGPFLWGDGHSSEQLAESLGGVPVIFVETEHFRIASTLDSIELGEDRLIKKRVEGELRRLKKRLPRIDVKERELDPWLRLHLYAQRCEELYAEFHELFHIAPDRFNAQSPPRRPGEAWAMGEGPYLGLHEKFSLLLTQKTGTLARYSAVYLDQSVNTPYRFYFADRDSFFYCNSIETLGTEYGNEVAFHCAVVYGLTQNLLNAHGGFTHNAPLWLRVGTARWFIRRIDPRWMVYATGPDELGRTEDDAEWAPKVRARVKNDYYPGFAEMLTWDDDRALTFAQHMMLWSRIDWMLAEESEALGRFLQEAMKPIPWEEDQDRPALVREQFARALEATLGTPEEIDAAWARWVVKRYPK